VLLLRAGAVSSNSALVPATGPIVVRLDIEFSGPFLLQGCPPKSRFSGVWATRVVSADFDLLFLGTGCILRLSTVIWEWNLVYQTKWEEYAGH